MISIEDMKGMIQEWMAQELSVTDLAKTYAELLCELNKQLEYCMDKLVDGIVENNRRRL